MGQQLTRNHFQTQLHFGEVQLEPDGGEERKIEYHSYVLQQGQRSRCYKQILE